jgi:hemoglobin
LQAGYSRDYCIMWIARNFISPYCRILWTIHSIKIRMTTKTNGNSSLYHRLGGYDVIAAFIDDVYRMLRSDPLFSRFAARSIDSQQRARQLLVDQVCQLAGGPCLYIGRDMKTAHTGLRITEAEWNISIDYTRQALQNHRVGKSEAEEVIELFQRYKNDIVEAPGSM